MILKNYPALVNGTATVLRLTEEDARRRGLTEEAPSPAVARQRAGRKARTPQNKAASAETKTSAAVSAASDASVPDRGF